MPIIDVMILLLIALTMALGLTCAAIMLMRASD